MARHQQTRIQTVWISLQPMLLPTSIDLVQNIQLKCLADRIVKALLLELDEFSLVCEASLQMIASFADDETPLATLKRALWDTTQKDQAALYR
eukprot:28333-Amphidinium_carterae.1